MKLPGDIKEYFRKQGARGGKTAANNMTSQQRAERAKRAVAAREAKRRKQK